MLKKKITISALIATVLAVGSFSGSDLSKKFIECTGKNIQFEHKDNYYCASNDNFIKDLEGFKKRLYQNDIKTDYDLGLGQLFILKNKKARDDIKQILLAKYNFTKKEFDGSSFNNDVLDQAFLLIEIANIECNGNCKLEGQTMAEKIYNLIK